MSARVRPAYRQRHLLYLLLLVVVFVSASGFVTGQKVYDQANLLTDAQRAELQSECLRVARSLSVDVVLLTVADAGGRSAMEVADDFYDDHAFGYDAPHGTGILLLIDMDNRMAWISTSGDAIYYFTDARIERVLDRVFAFLPDGDYYQSFQAFLGEVEYYMGLPPADSGDPTGDPLYPGGPGAAIPAPWWTRWIFQGGVAILAGILTVVALIARAGGVMTADNRTYMTGVRVNASTDTFLRRTVSVRKIPRNTNTGGGGGGSSVHTSGGGHSHGGGGRGF